MTHGNKALQEQRRALLRNNGCNGKIRHASLEAAERERRRAMRLYKSKLHVYQCDLCGGYHLGH